MVWREGPLSFNFKQAKDRRNNGSSANFRIFIFSDFKSQIKSNSLKIDLKNMQVIYTNSRGDKLDFMFPDKRFVNKEKIFFGNWQLFDGPFIRAKKGSKVFEIRYEGEVVVLDFNDFSVKHF